MTGKFARVMIGLTIFLSSYIFFKSPFEGYITYIVFLMFFPIYMLRYGIPAGPVLLFLPAVISGFVYVRLGQNNPQIFLKILIGFFSSVLFYRYVIQSFDFNVDKLYKLYLRGAVIVSVIGLFQVFSFLVGFEPGYNYLWILNKWGYSYGGAGIRLNSIFSEPAYFAGVIGPAFFVSVHNLFAKTKYYLKRWENLVIIAAYVLTFSSLGIISVFITGLLLLINYGFIRYAAVFGPLIIVGYFYAYNNIPEFQSRIDGTFEVFSGDSQTAEDLNQIHGSSFVLYNNFHIALENFRSNPIFGTGLGSHQIAFDRYTLTKMAGVIEINFNKADANSMFLRLMSETGLYGVLFILYFVFSNVVFRNKSANDTNWLLSNSLLVIIIVYLLRQGHYFINGFPLFLWMYYYLRKQNTKQMAEQIEQETTEKSEMFEEFALKQ